MFTSHQQEGLLRAIESGKTLKASCASVGASVRTVRSWVQVGTEAQDGSPRHVFAQRFSAAKGVKHSLPLSTDELVSMLEASARNGSIKAVELLLKRPWENQPQPDEDEKDKTITFEDELAQRRAQKVT